MLAGNEPEGISLRRLQKELPAAKRGQELRASRSAFEVVELVAAEGLA